MAWAESWRGLPKREAANESEGRLDLIPMPPEPVSEEGATPHTAASHSTRNPAWAKAQQALQKVVSVSTSKQSAVSINPLQAAMMQYYPWMPQFSIGMPNQNIFTNPSNSTTNSLWMQPGYDGGNSGAAPVAMNSSFHYSNRSQPQMQHDTVGYRAEQREYNRNTYDTAQINKSIRPEQKQAFAENRASGRYAHLLSTSATSNASNMKNSWRPGADVSVKRLPPVGVVSRPRLSQPTTTSPRFISHHQARRLTRPTGANTEPLASANRQHFFQSADNKSAASGKHTLSLLPSNATAANTNHRQQQQQSSSHCDSMPDGVGDYISRAYMAVGDNEEEKNKVEDYLNQKIRPLLQSGAAWKVNWSTEPLPSDVDFKLKTEWTPASQLSNRRAAYFVGAGRNTFWKERRATDSRPSQQKIQETAVDWRQSTNEMDRCKRSSSESPSETGVPLLTDLRKKKKKQRKEKKDKRWAVSGMDERREQAMREMRAQRFGRAARPKVVASRVEGFRHQPDDDLFSLCYQSASNNHYANLHHSTFNVIGTCDDIEKPYFRLTTAPDPSQVRPPKILHVALEVVKQKYAQNGDYRYASDQLKSIRQDLTIQCHRTDFTVVVYETAARVALENGDREEFNQCQSQLKDLYKAIPGCANHLEFTAYRLLYYVYMENTLDITTLLSELSRTAKMDGCVSFALSVRKCWALGCYHSLFCLYPQAPRMSSYIIDWFLERERKSALRKLLKAYRPTLPIQFLSRQLNLSQEECISWLNSFGIKPITDDSSKIDVRMYSSLKIS